MASINKSFNRVEMERDRVQYKSYQKGMYKGVHWYAERSEMPENIL